MTSLSALGSRWPAAGAPLRRTHVASLFLRRRASAGAELFLTQLQIIALGTIAHPPRINPARGFAREVRVDDAVHDHVRAVVAEVEARDGADAHERLAPHLLVVPLQLGVDELSPLVPALRIAAAADADEELLFEGVVHVEVCPEERSDEGSPVASRGRWLRAQAARSDRRSF